MRRRLLFLVDFARVSIRIVPLQLLILLEDWKLRLRAPRGATPARSPMQRPLHPPMDFAPPSQPYCRARARPARRRWILLLHAWRGPLVGCLRPPARVASTPRFARSRQLMFPPPRRPPQLAAGEVLPCWRLPHPSTH